MGDNDHVSQPVAALLKETGWEGETASSWTMSSEGEWIFLKFFPWSPHIKKIDPWLPAPSIGELRERLAWEDFAAYYRAGIKGCSECEDWNAYSEWLYTITASADSLAEVWLWANKKGE